MDLTITTILVPTDFSANSQQALALAEALARRLGAALHLLHVCVEPPLAGATIDGAFVMTPDWYTEFRSSAEAQLKTLAGGITGLTVTTEVVFGRPAACITAAATQRAVDLIVMGTHGHGPFMHLMLGSVAERVVRMAPCPVLTVRQRGAAVDEQVQPAAARAMPA